MFVGRPECRPSVVLFKKATPMPGNRLTLLKCVRRDTADHASAQRALSASRSQLLTPPAQRAYGQRWIFVPGPQQHHRRNDADDEEQQPTADRHAVDGHERDAGEREPDTNYRPAPS